MKMFGLLLVLSQFQNKIIYRPALFKIFIYFINETVDMGIGIYASKNSTGDRELLEGKHFVIGVIVPF